MGPGRAVRGHGYLAVLLRNSSISSFERTQTLLKSRLQTDWALKTQLPTCLWDDCEEGAQIMETDAPVQPRVGMAYMEPSRSIYARQHMVIKKASVFLIQPRQQRYVFTLVPNRVNLPSDTFFPHSDRPRD